MVLFLLRLYGNRPQAQLFQSLTNSCSHLIRYGGSILFNELIKLATHRRMQAHLKALLSVSVARFISHNGIMTRAVSHAHPHFKSPQLQCNYRLTTIQYKSANMY